MKRWCKLGEYEWRRCKTLRSASSNFEYPGATESPFNLNSMQKLTSSWHCGFWAIFLEADEVLLGVSAVDSLAMGLVAARGGGFYRSTKTPSHWLARITSTRIRPMSSYMHGSTLNCAKRWAQHRHHNGKLAIDHRPPPTHQALIVWQARCMSQLTFIELSYLQNFAS